MSRLLLIPLALVAGTLALYAALLRHEFINYDDPMFVSENRHVQQGLTPQTFRWAMTDVAGNYWHPVTSFSHLLVVELLGPGADAHHLASILLHAANAVGVFLVLRLLTASTWPAAVVAALFAWHPLRVEPVAWVTERSTLLCGLFSLTLIGCYAWFARAPSVRRYLLLPPLLCLAMLAKPTAMSLPLVLLLLDVWPLRRARLQPREIFRLVAEKIPLLVIVVALVIPMLRLHAAAGAFRAEAGMPLSARLARSVVHYVWYLGMTFWPHDLVMPYPPFAAPSAMQVTLSAALLCGITAFAFILRSKPWIAVGWLWFVVTLAPMVGLLQVRDTPIADRYTYFADIGILIAVVWGAEALARGHRARYITAGAAAATCVALAVLTGMQLRHWRDSHSLFSRAVAIYPINALAHNQLGESHSASGRMQEALHEFRTAVQQKPAYPEALNNLGAALFASGDVDAALVQYDRALQLDPDSADTHNNVANAFMSLGRGPQAIDHYRQAARLNPDSATIRHNLATALAGAGRVREAIEHDEAALAIQPNHPEAHYTLGMSLVMTGHSRDGLHHLLEAARLRPTWAEPLTRAAWVLATHPNSNVRDAVRAVHLADRACEMTRRSDPVALDTLGAALAEAGQWERAIAVATEAGNLARTAGNISLAREINGRIEAYRAGRTVAMTRAASSHPAGVRPD